MKHLSILCKNHIAIKSDVKLTEHSKCGIYNIKKVHVLLKKSINDIAIYTAITAKDVSQKKLYRHIKIIV